MKPIFGSIFLIMALVACCFLHSVQAAPSANERRSIVSDADSATQLTRRWWFGFTGSLGRLEGRNEIVVITPDGMVHRRPAHTAETNRWLNELRRKGVKYVVVDEDSKTAQSDLS